METDKAWEIEEEVKLYCDGEVTKRNEVGIAAAESLKNPMTAVQRINDLFAYTSTQQARGNNIIQNRMAETAGSRAQ